jgi:hypothetical protein
MWLGGLVVTLHIDRTPRFQVPLPFTRLAFGVWRSACSSSSSKPWPCRCGVRCAQRLEGSRFTPLQVLAVRAEETNPELPDVVTSRRLPGTSPAFGLTHAPQQLHTLEDEYETQRDELGFFHPPSPNPHSAISIVFPLRLCGFA